MLTQQLPVYSQVAQVQTPNIADLVITSTYGIPRPLLPVFRNGLEIDFALMNMALDNLLDNHSLSLNRISIRSSWSMLNTQEHTNWQHPVCMTQDHILLP